MSTFPGTYIPTGVGSTARLTHIVDDLLTPRILSFREIRVNDEACSLCPDGVTWKTVFGNWLEAAPLTVVKNGVMLAPDGVTGVNLVEGRFQCGEVDLDATRMPRDHVECSYVFDYFPQPVLESLLKSAVSMANTAGVGSPSEYTIDNVPASWEGIVTDLAYAMCIERLLLDYDLWRYRLVFAIGPEEVYNGGGDIAGQLTTLKQNAEERAYKSLDNEKVKCGNVLSKPTAWYYASVRGRSYSGIHGIPYVAGRQRGWKPNRI